MTAAEHLARAETLLERVRDGEANWNADAPREATLEAIGHALAAVAIELGAPHGGTPGQAAGNG